MDSILPYDGDYEKAGSDKAGGKGGLDSVPAEEGVAIVAVNEKRDLKRGLEQ